MATKTRITPSPEARRLFGRMVARSDDTTLQLGLADTIGLQVDLKHEGADPHAQEAVSELLEEEWIDAGPEGSWILH